MLLTITYSGQNTDELGYLLHKNPSRPQKFDLAFGSAYVFYPCISNEKTQAALLLDINPIALARGKVGTHKDSVFDYVNDRPYVASSFLSVAIKKVFRTAMTGQAGEYQALSDSELDLEATIAMLPCRSDPIMINKIFEALGYKVNYEIINLDDHFPEWGKSNTINLNLKGKIRLRDLLSHLYVLIPVFDHQKHYWVGDNEVEKLLHNAEDWLPHHPEKQYITSRYLKRLRPLVSKAFMQLVSDDTEALSGEDEAEAERNEKKPNLNEQRFGSVITALKNHDAKSVIDIGCGEGKLLRMLAADRQFTRISGTDVSHLALKRAEKKLHLDSAGDAMQKRISLFQSSIMYKDSRLQGYDAVCAIEVIEHLDLARLTVFEQVLFAYIKAPLVIITTPNREYNTQYERIAETDLRHTDHRFEWTRGEFQQWAKKTAEKYGYTVQFSGIGESDENLGEASQMGVFKLCI